ncbi:MAG: hypothetical protein JXO44_14110 [Clostridia bacterium]|nr:hypothetical protein [Clostridia bacterium]
MSDGLFVGLVLLGGILAIVLTSGFVGAIPGLFNPINRVNSKDTTRYNDINTFMKTMDKDQKKN